MVAAEAVEDAPRLRVLLRVEQRARALERRGDLALVLLDGELRHG